MYVEDKEEKEDYTPTLLTEKEKQLQQILGNKTTVEPTSHEALHMHFFNNNSNIPNLFKFALSATTIFKKLNFSIFERALSLAILASLLFLPYVNIALLKNYEQQYKTATLEIFQSLNPDTRRVINAKLQMDQIITTSSETIQVSPEINLSALNYLDNLDLKTIKRSKVNFAESIVELDLDGFSAIKYTFFLKLVDRFDATIVEDRTQKLDGKISGTLILGLSND